jgi:hypothetical protein
MKKKYSSIAMLKLVMLFILTTIGSSHFLTAQINTNKIRVDLSSLSFRACSDANNGLSTVTVQSKQATTTDFEIAFDLPDGVFYQAGTGAITAQTGSGDFSFMEVDISNLNQPVFRLERPSNAPWQINDQVTFTYQKTADCDAVQYSYGGGLFKDVHTITFNDHQGAQTASDNDLSVNSYNLLRAFLAVDDIAPVSGYVGDTQIRNIVIRNSGNGSVQRFDHRVEVSPFLIPGYQLSFNGTVLTPTNITGGFHTYTIDLNLAPFAGQVGDGDNQFENESITLVEQVTLSDCAWSQNTRHSPRWGCSPGTYCQIGTAIAGQWAEVLQEHPNLSLTPINHPAAPRWDAPVTYTNRIANNPTAENAYNVKINIGYGWSGESSSETNNNLYGDDHTNNRQLDNFRFAGGSSFTPTRRAFTTDPNPAYGIGSYFVPADFFTVDPDGPGGLEDLDGDGFYDDLAPGQSTDVLFDMTMLPMDPTCDAFNKHYLYHEQLRMEVWSVNTCNNPSFTHRIDINRSEVNTPGLFNWENPWEYDMDAEFGETFHLTFVGRLDASYASPTCNGIPMFGNDASTSYRVEVTVPNGFSLDASADARYSQSGNTITFVETNLANFVVGGYSLRIPIDIPINVDCGLYSGSDYLELPYTTFYDSNCFDREIHCGTFPMQTHCPDGCSGPVTESFDANRVTAGWTDNSMASKVTLDPAVHAMKYYMAKDEMVITSSAIMRNDVRDNLFLEIRYVTDNNGINMSDVINFTSGTITINDLSSGSQTTAITVPPTINTFGINDNRMTFDLSSYRSIISPTYQYGEGLQQDEIQVELRFTFNDSFPNDMQLYQFHTFYGEFYSRDGVGNKISCDFYRDRAFFFDNRVGIQPASGQFVTGCDEVWLRIQLEQSSGTGDRFPNEFRPPVLWQSATIEIPQGMQFNAVASSDGFPFLQPENERPGSWNNGLNFSVSGNFVTITPGPRFIHLDQGGNNYPNINIPLIATSAATENMSYTVSATFDDYAYADSPENRTESLNEIFNYYNTAFNIQTATPTVIGNGQLASFTVDISNGNVQAIDYNWLRVNPGPNFQMTNAFLVDGGSETPLNIVAEGGIYYIEYGAMPAWDSAPKTVRFEGTFDSCNIHTLRISQNYDCFGYPTTYTGLPYFYEREVYLEPVPATLQLDILSQPTTTVDTCTDFDVVLEVRNAGEGDLTDPMVTFDIPGDITGLTFTDLQIEYPRNSGNFESITPAISGNTVTIDLLQHSIINTENGISGSYGAAGLDEQIAIITMTLNPQCNYRSNTGTEYVVYGNNPCGTPAVGNGSRLASDPVIITGAEPPYSTNSVAVSSPNIDGCDTETVSVETYIVDGTTGSNDFTRVVLPPGMIYVPGSFVSTGTVTATYVTTNTVGDHQEIEIALPAGAGTTELIAYDFDVESTASICAGTYDIDLSTYVTVSGLTCGGVACGTTEVETGTARTQLTITKGVLDQSAFAATAVYVQGSPNNYAVEIGLENTGAVDLAAGITYEVFCADGAGVKTGTAIYSGSLGQAIPVGGSIQESFSFDSGTFCGDNSNIVVEFAPGSNNCFCDVLSVVIASEPSPAFGELSFVNDNITVNESNGTATLEVIFNGNFPGGFTVDFNTLPNTATAPNDFILTNNTLSFNGTDGEIQIITIPIVDDTVIEPTENFFVDLLNPSSGIITILGPRATVTILDDDGVPGTGIAFDNDNITVNEGDGTATVYVVLTGNVAGGFTVDFATADGSAAAPGDYTTTTGQLTFVGTDGETQPITVPIIDDNIIESLENLLVNLSNISTTLIPINENQATINIIDNDGSGPGEGISVADFTVDEGVGTADFVITYTGPTVADAFTVDFSVTDGTAINPDDYTVGTVGTSVTFPAGTVNGATQVVTINIVDDAIIEGPEHLNISLSNISNPVIAMVDADGIGNITDNDGSGAGEGISVADFTVDEGVGTADFVITYTGPTVAGAFTVDFVVSDGTAVSPDDYFVATVGTSVTFPAGTVNGATQFVKVVIIDDHLLEPAENINITLSNVSNPGIGLVDANGLGTILDNDTDNDNDGISDLVDLDDDNDGILDSNESQECIDDDYFAWEFNSPVGTRTNDFVQNPAITNWLAVSRSIITTGSGLTDASPASELQLTDMDGTTFTEAILQNEYVEVSFTTGTNLVDPIIERMGVNWYRNSDGTTVGNSYDAAIAISDDNFATYRLLNVDVRVHYPTNGISEFFNLTAPGSTINLAENTTYTIRVYTYNQQSDGNVAHSVFDDFAIRVSACLEQDSDGDSIPDHLELDSDNDGCFDTVEAGHTDGDNDGILGTSPVTVDSDGLVIGQGGYTGTNPNVTTPLIPVVLDTQPMDQMANIGGTVTYTAAVSGGTALSYQWQESTDNGGSWNDIVDGGIYAGATTTSLSLTGVAPGDHGKDYRLVVTSADNNCDTPTSAAANLFVRPTLTVADATAAEGDNLAFVITPSHVVEQDITFDLTYVDISTTPSDYVAITNGTLPANAASVTINVLAVDDTIIEPTETFTFGMTNGNGFAGDISDTAIGTITDNDGSGPGEGISVADFTVDEGVGTADFVITYTGPTVADAFTVDFVVSDGTAMDPADYSVATVGTSVTFPAGTVDGATQVVTINIVDDAIIEGPEDLNITLSNISNPGIAMVDADGIGTITDNDGSGPGEGISVADFTVDESVGTADFVITYTGPTVADAFTVDFVVSDGTAIDPDDYSVATVGTSVTFPAGTVNGATQVVTINIVDDAIIEGPEDLNITLSNISNPGIAMVDADGIGTITDNDGSGPGEGISVADFTVDESVGTADFVITYTGPTVADAFTVDFVVSDGTAIDPDDYSVATVGTSVTFPAGTVNGATQVVTINIVDDTIIEGPEDLNITLSNISNPGIAMVDADGIGTITDNDGSGPGEGISVADFTVDESVGTADFVITYTGPTVAGAFTVDFVVSDGTAIDPDDYSVATVGTSVTFPAGTVNGATQVVTINIVDDTIIEDRRI